MENIILCSQCMRHLRSIEKAEKEIVSTKKPASRVVSPQTKILRSLYGM